MILYFRTKRNANGNCKALAIDINSRQYATALNGWICKEYPVLTVRDMQSMIDTLIKFGFTRIERM